MSNYKISGTDLVCLECGNISTIQRKKAKLKEVGHIKTLYCFCCMKRTRHYEVIDVSSFIYNNIDKTNLDEDSNKVLNFLVKREECKNGRKDQVFRKVLTRK